MAEKRFRCAQKTCPNTYNEVIGGDGWGGTKSGADCLPCYFAGMIRQTGSTPERIEGNLEFMAMMETNLRKGGWTWQQVKESFARGAALR